MEPRIRESGTRFWIKDIVEDIKGMLTVLYMKDTGRMTKLMDEEESSNWMVTSMKAILKMIKPKVVVLTHIPMDRNM